MNPLLTWWQSHITACSTDPFKEQREAELLWCNHLCALNPDAQEEMENRAMAGIFWQIGGVVGFLSLVGWLVAR